jgi:hypothetical protein
MGFNSAFKGLSYDIENDIDGACSMNGKDESYVHVSRKKKN